MFTFPEFNRVPQTFDQIVEPLKNLVSDLQSYRDAQAQRIDNIEVELRELEYEQEVCIREGSKADQTIVKLNALVGEG